MGKKINNKKIRSPFQLSLKESRAIIKENQKITKQFEKRKRQNINETEYITKLRDSNNIIEIENLHTYFYTDIGVVKSVNGISFEIPKNSVVGIVGESGCGKSVTSLSIMQLVQAPQGQIVDGSIKFAIDKLGLSEDGKQLGYDIAKMPTKAMYKIRGKDITMIFQEPMTSLNPVFKIGKQLDEVVLLHSKDELLKSAKESLSDQDKTSNDTLISKQARLHSINMLDLVGISMPESIYNRYPHELSGGMRQRVMIAMAISSNPKLIIADEPTTALDVTIQAQILDLLKDLQKKTGCSIMLITHDLGVIAETADYVVVMYAGRIVEKGTVREIFKNPLHPYTIGLQKSKPVLTLDSEKELYSIPGQVPNPINMPTHCFFKDRCNKCIDKCLGAYPNEVKISKTHSVFCHLYEKGSEV